MNNKGMELPKNQIHVWRRDGSTPDIVEGLNILLTESERKAADEMPERRKVEFIISRGGMRRLAAFYTGANPKDISIELNERGRPLMRGTGVGALDINVSHVPGLHVFAAAGTPVGIDIERIRPLRRFADVLRFSYSLDEAEWVTKSHDETEKYTRFFRLWSLKEAAVKALGLDMMVHGASVQFDIKEVEGALPVSLLIQGESGPTGPTGPAGKSSPPFELFRPVPLRCVEISISPGLSSALCYQGPEKRVLFKGPLPASPCFPLYCGPCPE